MSGYELWGASLYGLIDNSIWPLVEWEQLSEDMKELWGRRAREIASLAERSRKCPRGACILLRGHPGEHDEGSTEEP